MLIKMIKSFLKIGTIGFGGGSALVPVVEKEIVTNQKLIKDDDYTDYVIVANITPGALPVKLAQGIGEHTAGIKGGIYSAFSVALPGSILCVLLLSLLSVLSETVLKQIEFFSVGIAVFIIFLILLYIKKVLKESKQQSFYRQSILIMLVSFFLTFGKEIRQLLSVASNHLLVFVKQPLFDIQIVDLLLLVFFLVFFIGEKATKPKLLIASLFSILYLLAFGKAALISFPFCKPLLYGILLALSVLGVFINNKSQEDVKRKFFLKKPLITLTIYLFTIALFLIFSALFSNNSPTHTALDFTLSGILSTLTSFGGGEAFLSVAQGVFVDNHFISADVFYQQIVPIANALPGPILVKILAGIGYVFGFRISGNIFTGYLFSLLGISVGVGTSSAVFAFIYMIYNSFKSLSVFTLLKKWILPVICGLLLSTILSMLVEMLKTTAAKEINSLFAFLLFLTVIAVNYILHKKYKLNDLLLIVLSGILSITAINLL